MSDNETGWVKDNGSYYYYYSDGSLATGWQKLDGDWYYFYGDGSMTWSNEVDGYYLGSDGRMVTNEGWVNTDENNYGTWYYVGSEEKVVTGWNKIGDDFHYFNHPGGSMTWSNTIDGFDIDSDGKIVSGTGWLQDEYSENWYHFSDGKMSTGWIQDGSNWYYLNNDGTMATGWQQVDGDWYYFYSDGTMATGWVNDGTGWYYLYGNGSMAWGKTVDGYLLDNGGKMVTGTGWQALNGDWYYLNGNKEETGWIKDGDNWYYLYGDNGSMAWGTTIDGYHLNNDGQWVVNSDDDEINSLPEYDPLTARLTENKGTRVKKKGVNGEYFAGTIDEFGNFVPDDIEGFTNIKINNDPTSTGSRVGGFVGGGLDSASNQIEGALNIIRHPVDTAENLGRLVTDSDYRKQAASSIVGGIHDAYENDVTNGDPTTEAYFWGEAAGEIGTLFLTDGAGEGAKEEEMVSASSYIKGVSNRSKILNVGDDILDTMESNGGHTLDRHVGKSKEYLEERVGNMRQGADGATSFSDKNTAIKATKDVLNQNLDKIDDWLVNGTSNRITLTTEHDFSVGYGVLKDSGGYVDNISKTVTVIQKTSDNELGFKIITCYPKLN